MRFPSPYWTATTLGRAAAGIAIARTRRKRRVRRRRLAKLSGLPYRLLYNLERGRELATLPLLQRIASALEVPLAQLVLQIQNEQHLFPEENADELMRHLVAAQIVGPPTTAT